MPVKNIITGQRVTTQKLERAVELRQEMTPAEWRLWERLRADRLDGWHFRRQQVVDGFIVDFYCHQGNLVVEVDGEIHEKREEEDARRDEVLARRGLRVMRFTNRQVMNDVEEVERKIKDVLGRPPVPLFEEEERRGGKGKEEQTQKE